MSQTRKNLMGFVIELKDLLKENRPKEALNLFKDNNYESVIKDSAWDVVPIVLPYLTAENAKNKGELVECCEAILNILAEQCHPSELVLELLEQVDSPNEDVKFCAILRTLSKSFNEISDKAKPIEWCVGTIRPYVDGLPVPVNENSDVTSRIETVYNAILSFLEALVDEVALENNELEKYIVLRGYLASLLLYLLGKPLCYLQNQKSGSDLNHFLAEKIILCLARLSGDIFWFLDIINVRCCKSICIETNKAALFESVESVPDLAYANLYFHILTRAYLWEKAPQIYHPEYIFEACAYLVNNLLQGQNILIGKGLNLMDELLKRMEKRTVQSEVLKLDIYSELFNSIVRTMIYCDNDKERKRALCIFREYLEIFNMEARYMIIFRLYQTSDHSGFLSLITSLVKASILECLQASPPIPYFLGSNFKCLLKQACKLPHGSGSDLIELSDEVITSLNLLRFLFIRDRHNETGIWNMIDELDKDYLKPLSVGIYMCRGHWTVKTKDLEELKHTRSKNNDNIEVERSDTEISLIVGGQKLPKMPVSEKIKFCYQALNGLDVMESILNRVNECITSNPLKTDSGKVKI